MVALKENLKINFLSLMENTDVIAQKAFLFKISSQGFFIKLNRKDLPSNLKTHLNLKPLNEKAVMMHVPNMDLDLDGTIVQTRHLGRGNFEIFVKFFDHVPRYWIDCLLDMLNSYPEGEFSKIDTFPKVQPSGF